MGSHSARMGHDVLGIGRASQPGPDWPGTYVQTDVATSDLASILRDFKPNVILHAAGTASVGASIASPLDDLRASMLTWANMLDGVRRSGLNPLLLFPSSAAVYGAAVQLPINEDSPATPLSPYGFHKAACELLAKEYAQCFDLRIVVCRLFSVFGPSQRRLLVWELFRQAAGPSDAIRLSGTGDETRDYLHSEDVAQALLDLAEGTFSRLESGQCETINIGSGEETKVLDLAAVIRDLVAPGKQIAVRGEVRPGDPRNWQADIARLRLFAPLWQPRALQQGLSDCIRVWRDDPLAGSRG